MKKKLGLLASSMIVLAAQSSAAIAQGFDLSAFGLDCNLCPYVGADVAWRNMRFVRDLGGKLTKNHYPQGNVYVGLKFNDCVGIEGGFESTTTARRTASIQSDDVANFGIITDPDATSLSTFVTSTKIYGWHADLVGFYPIWDDCLSLIGSIGVAELRLKIKSYPTLLSGGAVTPSLERDTLSFHHSKYVARAGLGLQYMITSCAGVRAMLNWENTNRFKNLSAKGDASIVHRATLRNSTLFSLGLFYNF